MDLSNLSSNKCDNSFIIVEIMRIVIYCRFRVKIMMYILILVVGVICALGAKKPVRPSFLLVRISPFIINMGHLSKPRKLFNDY